MKNNDLVIHSTDPWLLARLSTDLMVDGYKNDENWNNGHHCFIDGYEWIAIYSGGEFAFHNHDCYGDHIRFTLTEENYIDVLKAIVCDY